MINVLKRTNFLALKSVKGLIKDEAPYKGTRNMIMCCVVMAVARLSGQWEVSVGQWCNED
jgi:hypothetical protein